MVDGGKPDETPSPPHANTSRERIVWGLFSIVVVLLALQVATTYVGPDIPPFAPDPELLAALITAIATIYVAQGGERD